MPAVAQCSVRCVGSLCHLYRLKESRSPVCIASWSRFSCKLSVIEIAYRVMLYSVVYRIGSMRAAAIGKQVGLIVLRMLAQNPSGM